MSFLSRYVASVFLAAAIPAGTAQAATVFDGGTIFISDSIVTAASPSAFTGLFYAGVGDRRMFDRRANAFVVNSAYLFNATFADGLGTEIQVNPEFASVDAAMAEASRYGQAIGQLPTMLRTSLETVWIHQGVQPFGGGNNNLLIHTGQADRYVASGILEETFIHEATHTSLDAMHARSAGWLAAQAADPRFISPYAEQNPLREDLAETFLMWLAVRHFTDSLSASDVDLIESGIPNRLAYLDAQNFNLYPLLGDVSAVPEPGSWATMIAGFMLIGGAARRRRHAVPA